MGSRGKRPTRSARRLAGQPVERNATVRESLRSVLLEGAATSRDLSREVGIPERDVAEHLEHLSRSLRRSGERLRVEPARCFGCDYVFSERQRLTRPGRCPSCHGRRISLPVFSIEPGSAGP